MSCTPARSVDANAASFGPKKTAVSLLSCTSTILTVPAPGDEQIQCPKKGKSARPGRPAIRQRPIVEISRSSARRTAA